MTTNPFAKDPFELPPGPERRKLMREQGWNVSFADFTEAERTERDAAADALIANPPAGS